MMIEPIKNKIKPKGSLTALEIFTAEAVHKALPKLSETVKALPRQFKNNEKIKHKPSIKVDGLFLTSCTKNPSFLCHKGHFTTDTKGYSNQLKLICAKMRTEKNGKGDFYE